MAIGKKIRIYDLARDLKQDAKRVMEDLRREGADVSVPSNSVSVELAEKIRLKYFPKTDAAPKRAIKVIKATKKDESVEHEAAVEAAEAPQVTEVEVTPPAEVEQEPRVEVAAPDETATTAKPRSVYKLQKKAAPEASAAEAPAEQVEQPVESGAAEPAIEPAAETAEAELTSEAQPQPTNRVLRPTGTQIKQLTLTRDALEKGVKPGERVVSEAPTKTGGLACAKPPAGSLNLIKHAGGRPRQ